MRPLKPEEVADKLGITKAALAALRRRNPSFPEPIRMSQKVLRWDEDDVDNWLKSMKEKPDGQTE